MRLHIQLSSSSQLLYWTIHYNSLIFTTHLHTHTHVSTLTYLTHAQLPGRQHTTVEVRFSARRLLSSSATLLLVARGGTATGGTTLAFTLKATVTGANPQVSSLFIQLNDTVMSCLHLLIQSRSHFRSHGPLRDPQLHSLSLMQLLYPLLVLYVLRVCQFGMRLHTQRKHGVQTVQCVCGYHTAVGKLLTCKIKLRNNVGTYCGSQSDTEKVVMCLP